MLKLSPTKLKELRKRAGMTQEELSARAGFNNRAMVARIEAQTRPDDHKLSTLGRLAAALRCHYSRLLEGEPVVRRRRKRAGDNREAVAGVASITGSDGGEPRPADQPDAISDDRLAG
jgi:transcriptional regulator with XRE-family HTH domain